MRGFAFCFLLAAQLIVKAQTPDSLVMFSGYVLDEDSVPIPNALLVNYRTHKAYQTNERGFFKILVLKNDSLKLNHLSYEQKIIKPNNNPSKSNRYYLILSPYEINTIEVQNRNIEMENFKKNMKLIDKQMRENTPMYRNNTDQNAYAPPPKAQFYGVNFSELYRYFKTEKYRKKYRE